MASPLHPRNPFRGAYDFEGLVAAEPALSPWVRSAPDGRPTVDFSDPLAVRLLNRALLAQAWGIRGWDFPAENLCPAVPGRMDALCHVAELLAELNGGVVPRAHGLDVGTGASAIYALLGAAAWGWTFLASDIEAASVENARRIVEANRERLGRIEVRLQPQAHRCFEHVIQPGEVLDFTLCNPPFHADRASAAAGSARKSQAVGRGAGAPLNFAGTAAELICAGGEHGFLHRMAKESVDFGNRVLWFTSLVSRQAHVSGLERSLQKLGARRVVVLPMKTGNKVTRLVAWTFLSARQQEDWRRFRWSGRD